MEFDLTEKNKQLLRLLECDDARARLLFLPQLLIRRAKRSLQHGRTVVLVEAQVGIAVDILLVAPLRLQNLIALNWQQHFKEPGGSKGPMTLYVPKHETKSGKRELVFELPEEVADHIRWYRREVLPLLGSDGGDLFVSRTGGRKDQATLRVQITEAIEEHVGAHMTPHQFRHFAAVLFLDEHPESFQTVTDLLGHAWAKTTQIYAGSSGRRASRAYGSFILEQREALKLQRRRGEE